MAAEARSLGYGGIALVARAAGVSRVTVTPGWMSWMAARSRWAGGRGGRVAAASR